MKFNKFMIMGIFLLAILSLGALSAADANTTSDALLTDDVSDEVVADPVEFNDSDVFEREDPSFDVTVPDEIIVDVDDVDDSYMEVTLPRDVQGSTSIYFDDVFYEELMDDSFEINLNKLELDYGEHTWRVEFEGDEFYNPASMEGTFLFTFASIDFPEVESGDYLSTTIKLPDGANGYVTVNIDGKRKFYQKYATGDDDEMTILISTKDWAYGNHTYEVIYGGDVKYTEYRQKGTFEYSYTFELVYDESITAGEDTSIRLTLPSDVTGTVDIIVDGKVYSYRAAEFITLDLNQLKVGLHNATVSYYNGNYLPVTKKFAIDVEGEFIYNETIGYTEHASVALKLNKDAKGDLVVKSDGKVIGSAKLVNGEASVKLPLMELGYNELLFEYTGTDYTVDPLNATIYVTPRIVIPYDMIVGSEKYIIFQLPEDADGDFLMTLDGVAVDVNFINGKAIYAVDYLDESEGYGYDVEFYYAGGNYPVYEGSFNFEVLKEIPEITYSAPNKIYIGRDSKAIFYLPEDAEGEISLQLIKGDDEEGEIFYGEIDEGEAVVEFSLEETGEYTAIYFFEGDELYHEVEGSFKIKVLPKPRIEASDLKMVYSDGSKFKIRVYDGEGKIAKNTQVVFKINGKKFKTVKTDKKGYASIAIDKIPGLYKITVTALGVKVTKKVRVKHAMTFKKVTVKKGKKVVLTVKLAKINGKYLAKKRIVFKFNGVTYNKIKTDSKGVAKLEIGKDITGLLKKGKNLYYQASYLKETIKYKVKVK